MAGRIEIKGTIGNSANMIPTMIWQTKERQGKYVKVPFITFRMWAEDYTKAMIVGDDGTKRKPRSVVQVILPEDQRGQNMFNILAAGRKLIVKGRLTHRPNVGQTRDGDTVAYPNPVIYLDSFEFLDDPPVQVVERLLNVLQGECEVISDEQNTQYLAAFKSYYETLRSTVDERVVKEGSTYQKQSVQESSNPDDLGLQTS